MESKQAQVSMLSSQKQKMTLMQLLRTSYRKPLEQKGWSQYHMVGRQESDEENKSSSTCRIRTYNLTGESDARALKPHLGMLTRLPALYTELISLVCSVRLLKSEFEDIDTFL
jgi:hypothetical protein